MKILDCNVPKTFGLENYNVIISSYYNYHKKIDNIYGIDYFEINNNF